ncbi:hypothetical protein C5N97_03840 [Akkermansia muciniphila]|nr:hypothetical protein CXU04_05620 [Akkermansia muciniphila]QHV08978.1 hypothetical protein C5N96_03860 [Akkermansia muciniphila]QHV11265.1 hypothetical protein C5N97_03840 [Akkermansia muciniphila]
MLGWILFRPALFFTEGGSGRWLFWIERSRRSDRGGCFIPAGIDGKTAGAVMEEAGREAGLMRSGFLWKKKKRLPKNDGKAR